MTTNKKSTQYFWVKVSDSAAGQIRKLQELGGILNRLDIVNVTTQYRAIVIDHQHSRDSLVMLDSV